MGYSYRPGERKFQSNKKTLAKNKKNRYSAKSNRTKPAIISELEQKQGRKKDRGWKARGIGHRKTFLEPPTIAPTMSTRSPPPPLPPIPSTSSPSNVNSANNRKGRSRSHRKNHSHNNSSDNLNSVDRINDREHLDNESGDSVSSYLERVGRSNTNNNASQDSRTNLNLPQLAPAPAYHNQQRLQSPSPLRPTTSTGSGCFPLHEMPLFKKLDSFDASQITALTEIIELYFKNSDFKKHPLLSNPNHRATLKRGMGLVYKRENILFCIDVEAWEVNPKIVTEIGISIYDPRGQTFNLVPYIVQIHIIIKENQHLKNGRYVPEHSKNFNGGTTYIMGQQEAVDFTQDLIQYYFFQPKTNIRTCLVGHDLKGDISWFKNLGIKFPTQTNILDTQAIFSASHGSKGNSLKNALRASNLPYAFLHNAGNDSYYTLLLAMTLCDPHARKINRLDQVRVEVDPLDASPFPSPHQVQYLSPGQSPGNSGGKRKNKLGPNVSEFVQIHTVQEMIDTLFLEE